MLQRFSHLSLSHNDYLSLTDITSPNEILNITYIENKVMRETIEPLSLSSTENHDIINKQIVRRLFKTFRAKNKLDFIFIDQII